MAECHCKLEKEKGFKNNNLFAKLKIYKPPRTDKVLYEHQAYKHIIQLRVTDSMHQINCHQC